MQMADLEEARKAIEEYAEFVEKNELHRVAGSLAVEAFGLVNTIAENTSKPREYPKWSHNLELHAAEAKLDQRIAVIKELREKMQKVVDFAFELALQRIVGGTI
jgi:hypothetical protein